MQGRGGRRTRETDVYVPSRSAEHAWVSLKLALGVAVVMAAMGILGEARCEELDLVTPGAVYSLGAAADWSASRYAIRGGAVEMNRFGPAGGVLFTSALFMGSDLYLQKRGHRGAAKALRVFYVVGVGALVANSLAKGQGVRRQ